MLLDNIPRRMYRFTICSKKEAVIRKPHLFMLNVEQLPSVQGPRGTLAGTDGGGSAVGPPHFALQLGAPDPLS